MLTFSSLLTVPQGTFHVYVIKSCYCMENIVYYMLLQLLASLSHEADVDRNKIDGLKPENIGKNRNTDIVPGLLLCVFMAVCNSPLRNSVSYCVVVAAVVLYVSMLSRFDGLKHINACWIAVLELLGYLPINDKK